MTVINKIEIDRIEYEKNPIRLAIQNNDSIESDLHVIMVVSNPSGYAIRYILAREFILRMEDEPHTRLYVIELAYKTQKFHVARENNPRHLRLRTRHELWHKENLINIGIQRLLPKDWRAVAWIDADIEFESNTWASDTLRILNGAYDIVQLFSHCVDMDSKKQTMKVFNSLGYQYTKKLPYSSTEPNLWHPGFAWACTRKAYDRMRGLFDLGIVGSGDKIMAMCLLQNGMKAIHTDSTDGYKEQVMSLQHRMQGLRMGYVPGVIRHHFHGSKKNRKYADRWRILVDHQYDPILHVRYDEDGILVPSDHFPLEMGARIIHYFMERNEDEGFQGR